MVKVLVVDDEPSILHSTAALLRDVGYETAVCADPHAIIETLERERPHILLQDIRMPGLDIERLVVQARSRWPELPIVLFTASMDADEVAERVQANGVIEKPFKPADLLATLTRAGVIDVYGVRHKPATDRPQPTNAPRASMIHPVLRYLPGRGRDPDRARSRCSQQQDRPAATTEPTVKTRNYDCQEGKLCARVAEHLTALFRRDLRRPGWHDPPRPSGRGSRPPPPRSRRGQGGEQ